MAIKTKSTLKLVLSNGYEQTICMDDEKAVELVKWYHDAHSHNIYELPVDLGQPMVLFKDSILAVCQ